MSYFLCYQRGYSSFSWCSCEGLLPLMWIQITPQQAFGMDPCGNLGKLKAYLSGTDLEAFRCRDNSVVTPPDTVCTPITVWWLLSSYVDAALESTRFEMCSEWFAGIQADKQREWTDNSEGSLSRKARWKVFNFCKNVHTYPETPRAHFIHAHGQDNSDLKEKGSWSFSGQSWQVCRLCHLVERMPVLSRLKSCW